MMFANISNDGRCILVFTKLIFNIKIYIPKRLKQISIKQEVVIVIVNHT